MKRSSKYSVTVDFLKAKDYARLYEELKTHVWFRSLGIVSAISSLESIFRTRAHAQNN